MNIYSILKLAFEAIKWVFRIQEQKEQEVLHEETRNNPRDVFKREFMRSPESKDVSDDSKTNS